MFTNDFGKRNTIVGGKDLDDAAVRHPVSVQLGVQPGSNFGAGFRPERRDVSVRRDGDQSRVIRINAVTPFGFPDWSRNCSGVLVCPATRWRL